MTTVRSIVFAALLALAQNALSADTVRITTGEYPPWTSEGLNHGGFTNHVITEAFELEGYDVAFTFYPWKRVYEAAKDGDRFQASSWWYPSEERAEHFYYSEPLLVDRTVFFHLKDNPMPDWDTLDDLGGTIIGATAGYTYTSEFWDAAESNRLDIQEAANDELNFRKLLKGRIDAFPTSDLVGQKLLKEEFAAQEAEKVTFHSSPLMSTSGHLLFSKKSEKGEELVAVFNRGLAKLRESGRYEQMMSDLVAGRYDKDG